MNFRKLITLPSVFFVLSISSAQTVYKADTIQTDESLPHIYLNLEIPVGEMFMKSSGVCGTSFSRLYAPDSFVHHHIITRTNPNGNQFRTIRLESTLGAKAVQPSPTARMRFTDQMTSLDVFSDKGSYKSEFLPDPSLSTDLYVDLGVGGSILDLSGLTLNNVSVNSAFSNVVMTYSSPNQTPMKKMDIHAASADLTLKNLEMARADLITIQNDMGATKLIIGNSLKSRSTIYLQSGVGSCTLVLDPRQPTQITLKSGFFASVDVADTFKELQKGVYTNKACEQTPEQCLKIICNIDFGSISVIQTE
ncbi:MAG: hypothetical protein SF052_17090 [Bacteroidia bacterium]|nr:hypothetical protein [Bacteroidia bacterium]